MGKYQVEAGLKVSVASEAATAVNDLGNLIKQQNQAQIDQNKLIAKVLAEVTEAHQKNRRELVQVERKQRDVTANKNNFTAAIIKAKSAIYDYTGALRNLGESIGKGLTVWAPWVSWIKQSADWLKILRDELTPTKSLVEELEKAVKDLSNTKPIDMRQILKTGAGTEELKLSGEELRSKYGDFYSTEDIRRITPEKKLAALYKRQQEFIDSFNEAADTIDANESKDREFTKKFTETGKRLQQKYEERKKIEKRREEVIQGLIALDATRIERARVEKQFADELNQNQLDTLKIQKESNEIWASIVDNVREIDRKRGLLGQAGKDALEAIQQEAAITLAEVEGGQNKGPEKTTKDVAKDFIKKELDDFTIFLEYWKNSEAKREQTWFDKLVEEKKKLEDKMGQYIKTDQGRAVAMDIINTGFQNYVDKAIAQRREEYNKLIDKVFPKEDEYLKERMAALEKPLRYIRDKVNREIGFNWMPLTHISSEDKANIEKQTKENTDWFQDKMAAIAQERNKKLENLESRRKEFEAFDVAGLKLSPEERLAQLRKFQDEELKIKLDALNEEERVKQEYAERDKKRREAEVTAFGNQFRLIDKNSVAWKKSDEAINTTIAAMDMLGVSEKKIFALQNYAKGIEASVDAINLQADAIIAFGKGDIKGGVALQAAAVSKGLAAYAYFKNSMEMGGKGGTAPSVGTATVTGSNQKERDITINMAFTGTAGAIIGPLADAFNQEASVPGGVRLNSRLIRK